MKDLFFMIMFILALPVIFAIALLCPLIDKITGNTDDNYGEDIWQQYF